MRIALLCQSSMFVSTDKYKSRLTQIPNGEKPIEVETELPLVPGEKYALELKGIFPGSGINAPCILSMLSFKSDEHLVAVDHKIECPELYSQK